MTIEELKAKVNELKTEATATREAVRDGIEGARKINDAVRAGNLKLRSISDALAPLEAAVAQYEAEAAAQAKAEANARAQAEAEARAKEPQPPNPLEVLTAEVKRLSEALAAKG